jgi:hypothetical protein
MTVASGKTRRFHHVGLRATEVQPNENFVAATRVWVTDPSESPYHIEWLRYEPDSYLGEDFKNTPHVAFVVDELEPWIAGKEFAIPPFEVGDPAFATVVFVHEDGYIVEYMAFKPGQEWFDPNDKNKPQAGN